jgi:AcrR family transcriptional regulator
MKRKQPKNIRLEAILKGAIAEFVTKGYERATVDSIAKKAGISKGGVYHHFKNKEELFYFMNQKLAEPINDIISQTFLFESAREALSFFIKSYFEFWKSHGAELAFFFLSMSKAMANVDLMNLYKDQTKSFLGFYEALFKKGVEGNEFYAHNTGYSAFLLMSLLDGMIGYIYLLDMNGMENLQNFIMEKTVLCYKKEKQRG